MTGRVYEVLGSNARAENRQAVGGTRAMTRPRRTRNVPTHIAQIARCVTEEARCADRRSLLLKADELDPAGKSCSGAERSGREDVLMAYQRNRDWCASGAQLDVIAGS